MQKRFFNPHDLVRPLPLTHNQTTLVHLRRLSRAHVFKNPYVNLVEKELEYFIESLSGEVKPMNSVERSIKILEIVEQVRRRSRRKN